MNSPDRVPREVGLVEVVRAALPGQQLFEVEVSIERDGDRRERSPPVELVEEGPRARLDVRRDERARVQAASRRRRGVGPGGRVVRERDGGKIFGMQVPDDLWPVARRRCVPSRGETAAVTAGEGCRGDDEGDDRECSGEVHLRPVSGGDRL